MFYYISFGFVLFVKSGFIFAVPYFVHFLMTIIVGHTVDRIRTRKWLSITTLRKAQAVIGNIGCFLK